MKIVKNLVEEDIILSNHKLSDKEIIRAYSVLVKKLNKQIVDLEIDNDLLIKDLEIYNKALELICYYIEYEYPKKNDDIYYRKARELEMIFLNKAKEKINEQTASEEK